MCSKEYAMLDSNTINTKKSILEQMVVRSNGRKKLKILYLHPMINNIMKSALSI